ncbi:MAG: site-specific integrase [Geminicoccaceae bacterium]
MGIADDVRDADGLRVLSYAQAQARAREFFTEMERLAESAEPAPRGPYTVADALNLYIEWFNKHRKSGSKTKAAIERHIRPLLGAEELSRLTSSKIREWHEGIAAVAKGSRARKQTSTELVPAEGAQARKATANRLLTILKAALNHAYREGKVAADTPWRRVQAFRGVDSARLVYLSADEAQRLVNACNEDFRRLVRAALETGCRYGELIRAVVSDFKPDAPSLLIRDAKSGRSRHVPLDKQAAKFLSDVTAGRPGAERIFLRSDGAPWGASHQARPLAEANVRAKIDPAITFHGLRHTWASLRIMRGLPLLVAAQVLGHSDTRMVEKHYGHLAKGYIADAIEATTVPLKSERTSVRKMARRD